MNHYKLSDISIGMKENFTVTVTEDMQNTFCQLTGDVNPMHMTDEYAKDHGFDSKLVYGMLTASFYSTLVGVYLPGENCLFHEVNSCFTSPVYVGDTLTIEGSVSEIDDRFGRIKIKASVRNQDGKKVSRATLVVGCRE